MVFNVTFNNISAISWQSVLLVEETGGPGENHLKVALNTITLTPCVFILKCVYSNNVGFTTTYAISAYHH
jgi:hypothetical protein